MVPIVLGVIGIEWESAEKGSEVMWKYLGKKVVDMILEWLGGDHGA